MTASQAADCPYANTQSMTSAPKGTVPISHFYQTLTQRTLVIGANIIIHLHNGLYYDWCKHEGTAVIGEDILILSPFKLYKQAAQLFVAPVM
jgi:hypothetical protein